jgi:phosphopantothenate-cysteine ligase
MLKDKTILVTSGGTRERIDDVRVMTNISSGALGCRIAQRLYNMDAHILYVHGKGSEIPCANGPYSIRKFEVESANDTMKVMETFVPQVDAVIHCMAVSDFTFYRDTPIKCKSGDPEAFIEFMRKTIHPNPKIIGMIKKWNPNVILIGFKFEVRVSTEELRNLAMMSIEKNGCDLVVANDKQEMTELQTHRAHFVFSPEMIEQGFKYQIVDGKQEIAAEIHNFLAKLWLSDPIN